MQTSGAPSDSDTVTADTTTPTVASAAPAVALAPTRGPAFVVYTIEPGRPTRRSTVIVPFDPSVPVRRSDGIVVLDDAAAPPVLRWLTFADDDPCGCGCDASTDDEGTIVELDAATLGLAAGSACDPGACAEVDAEREEEDDDEALCETTEPTFATMVGGRVFVTLDTHLDCEGANLYGNELQTLSMTRAEWTVPALPERGLTCEGDHSAAGWPNVRHERAPLPCAAARGGFRARGRGVDCERCDESRPGLLVARITRGMLQTIDVAVTGDGTGTAWIAETPVRASNCPSSADPCGDPAGFAPLGTAAADADFWVATDGSIAIALSKDESGRFRLATYGRGASGPIRAFEAGFEPSSVFGVRVHADVDLLARQLDRGLPARRNACAGAAPAATPAAARPALRCDAGSRPRDGACVALPLAASDVGFVDDRGGSGWGNRCVQHLRANELDAAEAACAVGLRAAERDTTRGAILYNLGLIARARGDHGAARGYFDRSLSVRPGNRTVEAARDALGE